MASLRPPSKSLEANNRRLSFAYSDLDNLAHLNTLYLQCKEQVLNGTHPVSRDTAIHLAAVQCFIDHGPYKKGVEGFIKAQSLLPKEYARAKEHEKNILHEYKELLCETEEAAKKRYCELCKSLPTYGVTFFVVKERQSPTERRLVTRLFGVSKDCVMRVDYKSKIVLKSWPLEQLRRWAASPSTFNIDFGDYTDRYYSAQTLQGEVIKKLIGEYVDIILKKSQIENSRGIEGDEGGIMLEHNIPAGRALPFFIENGSVTWRQAAANDSNGLGDSRINGESFNSLRPIASPIQNEFPMPLNQVYNSLGNNGFVPILPTTDSQKQHLNEQQTYLLNQASTPLNHPRGNIKTTITTQEVSFNNNNEPPQFPFPFYQQQSQLQWQQNNLLSEQTQTNSNQLSQSNVFQKIPIQNTPVAYPHQQQCEHEKHLNFDKFSNKQFIKIANDIPSSEFSSENGLPQKINEQQFLYANQRQQFNQQPQQFVDSEQHLYQQEQLRIQQQAQQRSEQQERQQQAHQQAQLQAQQQQYTQQQTQQQQQQYTQQQTNQIQQQQQQYEQQNARNIPILRQENINENGIERIASPIQQSRQTFVQTTVTTVQPSKPQNLALNQQKVNPPVQDYQIQSASTQAVVENADSAVESNVQAAEEARLFLTPESIAEIRELPEMVAARSEAGNQLNWLIVMGTHAVSQHLGTFVVTVAQIIESTSIYSNQTTLSNSITRSIISSGVVLSDLIVCIRELSALLWAVSEPVASKLLYKTEKLCSVFVVFMEQLHSQSGAKRAAILSAASLVGETTCALLSTTSNEGVENVDDNAQAFYDILNERIQNIASSTANVVLQAKTLPISAEQKSPFFHYATQVAFTASELIALSRVLASVLGTHSTSQQRIAESVQRVANAINEMVVKAGSQFAHPQTAPDHRKKYDQLLSTANFANNALHQFLNEIQQSSLKSKKSTV